MNKRVSYFQASPELSKKLIEFNTALKDKSAVIREFEDLITTRASQINGCGFCVDMHVKEAKIHGERELRLHHLAIWRESNLFTSRERAALAWTEILTTLPAHGVPDEVYARVNAQLTEQEMSDLAFLILTINGWNRLNVAFKTVPGSADTAFGLDKAGLN